MAQHIYVVGYHWNRLDEHVLNPCLLFTIKQGQLYYSLIKLSLDQVTLQLSLFIHDVSNKACTINPPFYSNNGIKGEEFVLNLMRMCFQV